MGLLVGLVLLLPQPATGSCFTHRFTLLNSNPCERRCPVVPGPVTVRLLEVCSECMRVSTSTLTISDMLAVLSDVRESQLGQVIEVKKYACPHSCLCFLAAAAAKACSMVCFPFCSASSAVRFLSLLAALLHALHCVPAAYHLLLCVLPHLHGPPTTSAWLGQPAGRPPCRPELPQTLSDQGLELGMVEQAVEMLELLPAQLQLLNPRGGHPVCLLRHN